jgi:hypothetical protein
MTVLVNRALEIKVEVEDTASDGRRVLIVCDRKGSAYPTFAMLGLVEVEIINDPGQGAAHVLFG